MSPIPAAFCISTSRARDRLSAIITAVQDPRAFCVLTRHGHAVAAIVSMAELDRIVESQDIEDVVKHGQRPVKFIYGKGLDARTNQEAAEEIRRAQMDRLTEREVLAQAGLEPVPGGEVAVEMETAREVRKVGWWRRWLFCKKLA